MCFPHLAHLWDFNAADAATAMSTIALCLFAGWQIKGLMRSAKASEDAATVAKQAVDIARNDFLLTQRPRLIVRRVEFAYPEVDGVTSQYSDGIEFTVANVGASQSFVREIYAGWQAQTNYRALEAPRSLERLVTGPILVSAGLSRVMVLPLDEAERPGLSLMLTQAKSDKLRLVVFGRVLYADGAGNDREARFFRVYSPSRNRFIKADDDDLDYSD